MSARERWILSVELQAVNTGWNCPGGIARKISARTGVPIADIVYPAPAKLSSALEYNNEQGVNLG